MTFATYQQNQKCLFLLRTATVCTIHRETAWPRASRHSSLNLGYQISVLLTGVCVQLSLCLQPWIIVYKINLSAPFAPGLLLRSWKYKKAEESVLRTLEGQKGETLPEAASAARDGQCPRVFPARPAPSVTAQFSFFKKHKRAFYLGWKQYQVH